MPKNNISLLERIASLENQKKVLVEKRKNELLDLIVRSNAITIDDSLLTGFLLFISDLKNKDHSILTEFKELAKRTKLPSRTKQANPKTTKKAS